jgi:hypothetical protein
VMQPPPEITCLAAYTFASAGAFSP